MMALPFFVVLIATVLAWRGARLPAIAAWLVGMVLILVLFRLHATDPLDLGF